MQVKHTHLSFHERGHRNRLLALLRSSYHNIRNLSPHVHLFVIFVISCWLKRFLVPPHPNAQFYFARRERSMCGKHSKMPADIQNKANYFVIPFEFVPEDAEDPSLFPDDRVFSSPKQLILSVNDSKYLVDGQVLSLKSSFFKIMLHSSWFEHDDEIVLKEISTDVFEIAMKSFMSNEIRIGTTFSMSKLYELLLLYRRFLFKHAEEALIRHLKHIFQYHRWSKVWHLFDISANAKDLPVMDECLKWIENNQTEWVEHTRTPFSYQHFRTLSLEALKTFMDSNTNIQEVFILL